MTPDEGPPRRGPLRDALALTVIGLVAFALSGVWYSPLVFGDLVLRLSNGAAPEMAPWKLAVAPLREILTATVVQSLVGHVRPDGFRSTVRLALVLWAGFYVVQLTGAILFDSMPWQLGAVHASDWLMKMLIITGAVTAWWRWKERRRRDDRVRVPVSSG
jgi:hypothetical protein